MGFHHLPTCEKRTDQLVHLLEMLENGIHTHTTLASFQIQYTNMICIITDNINPVRIKSSSEERIRSNKVTALPPLRRKLVTTISSVLCTDTGNVRQSKDELRVIAGPLSSRCKDKAIRVVVDGGAALLSDSVVCSWLVWAAVVPSSLTRRQKGLWVEDALHLGQIS